MGAILATASGSCWEGCGWCRQGKQCRNGRVAAKADEEGGRTSPGDIHNMPMQWVLACFPSFLNFWSDAPKLRSLGGAIFILFEICKKRPFRRGMDHWGGGG